MGKKSKKGKGGAPASGGDGKSRCCSCHLFLKKEKNGEVCPGCDKLYCDACASFGSRKNVGFIACDAEECISPPRCLDCAFGKTLKSVGDANKARRARGEPVVLADKPGNCDSPVSVCGHCHQTLCFDCHTFKTKGVQGHYVCLECYKVRCFDCCVESGDPKHFIMYCWGCHDSKCIECDPYKSCDVGSKRSFEYFCGKCCRDPDIVGGKQLMLAAIANSICTQPKGKKCEEKKED